AAILIRTMFLLALLGVIIYFSLQQEWFWVFIFLLIGLSQVSAFTRFVTYAVREVGEFALSARYRDFSRNYTERSVPSQARQLHRHFNEINSVFRQLSREREAQYQYLQKLLELVDTGILSYDSEGNVVWMNESLKRMTGIVYLKNLSALEKRDPLLYEEIQRIKPGDKKIIRINSEKIPTKILVSATAFQTDNQIFTLVAFQNINEALDETEAQAWQKILRVMTHEIMNSVGPITSLADTIKGRLPQRNGLPEVIADQLSDVELGLDTIRKRGQGLLRFAEIYRNFNKIAQPQLSTFSALELFENIYQLMEPSLERKGVDMEVVLKDTKLQFEADRNLIEQVLINLIINAIDAVKERTDPMVTLTGYRTDSRVVLEVADNGAGIPEEMMERIFIPFFSTKQSGSGIGLSLSRQIMLLHKGNIQVRSTEGKGSTFMLTFPVSER
ncbi:MAG: ATP-binding protein, partial [Saprospiraceae bacterium]|nr:ATP-binding protein [Saprospiraceae bacterium]